MRCQNVKLFLREPLEYQNSVASVNSVRDNYFVMNKYPFRVKFQATLLRGGN